MTTKPLEKAEGERDAIKATIEFLETEVVGHSLTPLNIHTVDKYIKLAEQSETSLMDVHTRIVQLKPTDVLLHTNEYQSLLKKVTGAFCAFHGIKAGLNPTGAVPTGIPQPSSSTATGSGSTDIRLPRFDIPKFNGNLLDWVQFRDLFQTVIHNNKHLSDAQKLAHLKSFLEDEPARLIKTMILTDANYSIAWDLLVRRYHNERELLFAVFRRFFNQPSVQTHSSESIRRLIDITTECIQQMQVLAINKDSGLDAVMMFCVSTKLDQPSKELWEQTLKDTKIPSLSSLLDFLETRARSLSASGIKQSHRTKDDHFKRTVHAHHVTEGLSKCKVCNGNLHPLYKCSSFMEKTPKDRNDLVKRFFYCYNCLLHGHQTNKCTSTNRCRTCNGRHHSLIHVQSNTPQSATNSVNSSGNSQESTNQALNFHLDSSTQSFLATAIIKVLDGSNNYQLCRAFLDSGSTASIITSACAQRLSLNQERSNVEVRGLSSSHVGHANAASTLVFKPHFVSMESFSVDALILPRVTGKLPLEPFNPQSWPHLHNLTLADPNYYIPASVDILLGSDIFWDLLLGGIRKGPLNTPTAVRSSLGWLIGGRTKCHNRQVQVNYAEVKLDEAIQRFWEIESIQAQKVLSQEETEAEEHFTANYSRSSNGRFTIRIPWKNNSQALGDSRLTAMRRLKQLERRLTSNPSHLRDYHQFMDEYLSLGHMELVPENQLTQNQYPTYFIPHHFVLKEDSTTTKFRVVFDASAKTSSGISLNQQMLIGPTIQDSLVDIVLRFRCHPIAFTADIGKMYRQILLAREDQDRHRILWRKNPEDTVKEYRLLTVTYGTAAAPFLATRVLQQLATDAKDDLPLAYQAATNDFYVDDLMSGAGSLKEAKEVQTQLLQLMNRGQLELRKWASNSTQLLSSLPEKLRELQPIGTPPTTTSPPDEELRDHLSTGSGSTTTLQDRKEGSKELPNSNIVSLSNLNGEDFSVKCLGIYWNTTQDIFQFQVNLPPHTPKVTKRSVLSEMSKLYDPLGWLSPIVVTAKIFMQSLWKLNASWDSELSSEDRKLWETYKLNLNEITKITIRRCILKPGYTKLILAGFCDGSEVAYAAVVYLCAFYDDQEPLISLVSSKTRVAPARRISVPRLELCGAVLLSQLLVSIQTSIKRPIDEIRAWTDSTIVLDWIRSQSSSLKTFVGNRVSEIQSNLNPINWFHVPGKDNPADCASRGLTPMELQQHTLWWKGPQFLQHANQMDFTPTEISMSTEELNLVNQERKTVAVVAAACLSPDFRTQLLKRFSSLPKIVRITAYVRRFVFLKFFPSTNKTGPLTACELQEALHTLVKSVQETSFSEDIAKLKGSKQLSQSSRLLPLSPFLDESGLLRVGGRLRHSSLSKEAKHPLLLPRQHRFVDILLQSKHMEFFHAGPQLLQSLIQQQFWIIRSRDAIRFATSRCMVCRKQAAKTMQTKMGDLPAPRVNPGRAFLTTGVDYAGPFLIKSDAPRSKIKLKAYLCIFVCFVTRAIHLEIASSLSTDAFIAALKRFISRRNKPSVIYSDCGTNFVGAAREIKETTSYLMSHDHNSKITNNLSQQGIEWRFNPPGSPHFGGLWEAGVKSVKFHLYRVMGTMTLNFEELTTLTSQIEACLNSRPLTPMSTSPDDLQVLTPGHFLSGGPMEALPQVDLCDTNIGRLDRWQLLQRKTQEFWIRWSSEYVSRLQQRPKWMKLRDSIAANDLVIIKDERLPPQKWKLGRVEQLHPGPDGITRVVTLKTAEGSLKRPIAKLCLLPLDPEVKPNED